MIGECFLQGEVVMARRKGAVEGRDIFLKVATYLPLAIGLAVLVIGRVEPQFRESPRTGAALGMIALSCFIFAATDAGRISVEQEIMLSRMRIAYRPAMGRIANAAFGVCLLAAALYFIMA
jgi:hypothetical protein